MNPWNAILGGLIATLVLSTLNAAGQGLGVSRMGLPFMLGTMFTTNRKRAETLGFLVHVANGWVFAFVYVLIFERFGRSGMLLGAGLGAVHGLVVLVALLPLLPNLHPRMATEEHGPEPTRALEPPGFLALNYGRPTPLLVVFSHAVYGVVLGLFYPV